MSELKSVIAGARALHARGERCLLATLVAIRGSSYRRPGARLLIGGDGVAAGSVSGGCLERDLARRGWWRTGGGAALVSYDGAADGDDLGERIGLGCNGAVDVLVERLPSDGGALAFIDGCFAREESAALATVFRSTEPRLPVGAWLGVAGDGRPHGTLVDDELLMLARQRRGAAAAAATATVAGGAAEALLEAIVPPPHLFVMGSGPDAVPLVALAQALGWTITIWAPRARFDIQARFAGADRRQSGPAAALTAAIAEAARPLAMVMSHDADRDREALAALLPSRARYIGVLGPKRRTERLLADIGAAATDRLHAPAGLSIGAETPAEIALSVIAEMQAALAGASGDHLKHRAGAIHDAESPRPPPPAAGDR
jgi:xanthine dehydrogenase accessory factor